MANIASITLPQFNNHLSGDYADITLPGLTVQAERGFYGDISIALPIITTTFIGLTGSIDGATLNLPAFTFNISTGLTNAILLPQLSLAGVGHSGFIGTYDKSLPRMIVNVKGTNHRNATFNVSLPAFTLDNNLLTGNISLASTRNLPGLTINATGFRGENGDGAITFPMFTMANESFQSLNGTVAQSLKMLTLDAYGDSYTNRII